MMENQFVNININDLNSYFPSQALMRILGSFDSLIFVGLFIKNSMPKFYNFVKANELIATFFVFLLRCKKLHLFP